MYVKIFNLGAESVYRRSSTESQGAQDWRRDRDNFVTPRVFNKKVVSGIPNVFKSEVGKLKLKLSQSYVCFGLYRLGVSVGSSGPDYGITNAQA